MKLFVAYTQIDGLAFVGHFDRAVPAYVGQRRDYAAVLAGQGKSSCVAVVAKKLQERRLMQLSLSRLGFFNTSGVYDKDPANLAAQIRTRNPDIVLISQGGQRDPVMEEVYRLAQDLFEQPGKEKVFVQTIF